MDVINLVSSDEEDNDGSVRSKIKANKNIVFKKVTTPKVLQNVKEVSGQKLIPTMVHPKNNNNNKQVAVIQGLKQQNQHSKGQQPTLLRQSQQTPLLSKSQPVLLTNPQSLQFPKKQHTQLIVSKIKFKDGKPVDSKKPMLNPASGITITAVSNSSKSTVIPNNHGNSTVSNVELVTIIPRTDKVKIVSKPNVPTVNHIQPAKSINAAISNHGLSKPGKRIIPTKISDAVTMRASSIEKSSDSDMLSRDSSSVANDEVVSNMDANGTNKPEQDYEPKAKRPKIMETVKEPMHQDYVHLIEVCKKVDPTEDMKKVGTKLEKYYYKAHTMFVKSKSFHKLVESVTAEIQAQPKLVYKKINNLLEELKSRKATENETVPTEENTKPSEVDGKKAKMIQKLSNALRDIHWRIKQSEEAEVDWDEENNSKYIVTERYKKRAWEIYEKLCDLTGESRSAERIVKKPIRFNGTKYKEFNRKLENFINGTKSFPDMFDVLRIMDYCSERYNYVMSKEHRKTVAQEAFHDVGTLLQKRRKSDLYEMVEYFAPNHNDPAGEDPSLKMKLEENQRHYSRCMKEVIEKYTNHHRDSEVDEEEDSPVKIEPKTKSAINVQVPPVSARLIEPALEPQELNLSAEIDMLNDSVTFISDSGDFNDISKSDSILIDEQDVVHELEREFLPTITSVTSLHPSEFNNLMNFEPLTSSPMESAEIS